MKNTCNNGHPRSPDNVYIHGHCRECKLQRQRANYLKPEERQKVRLRQLKNTYGLTNEQYLEMFTKQNNKCAICGKEEALYVDHNHVTQQVRGLLCVNCNTRVVPVIENMASLIPNAVRYLIGIAVIGS